jgi:hypothetical protein
MSTIQLVTVEKLVLNGIGPTYWPLPVYVDSLAGLYVRYIVECKERLTSHRYRICKYVQGHRRSTKFRVESESKICS